MKESVMSYEPGYGLLVQSQSLDAYSPFFLLPACTGKPLHESTATSTLTRALISRHANQVSPATILLLRS